MPISAGSTCDLDTSSFEPADVALAVSQATLAAPLLHKSAQVQLFCDGQKICTLSAQVPNVRLRLDLLKAPSFECVGPEGSCVHITGYTYVQAHKPSGGRDDDMDMDMDGGTDDEWEAIQRERKRRLEELHLEAAAAAKRPSTAPKRVPRLTFNPEVLVAEYVPKRVGISPSYSVSLDVMVAEREALKARERALESMADDGDDDGETLQHVLAELLSSSVSKLRNYCGRNGLPRQGDKGALIERLVEHIAADMRVEREVED